MTISPAKFLQFDNAVIFGMSLICACIVTAHLFELWKQAGGVRALYNHIRTRWLRVRSTTGGEFAVGFLVLTCGISARTFTIWYWRANYDADIAVFPYYRCMISDFLIIWGFMCIIRCIVKTRVPSALKAVMAGRQALWPWISATASLAVSVLFALLTI